MNGYVIFLANSIVRISSQIIPDTVFEKKVSDDILLGSKILDPKALSEIIGQLIFENYGSKAPKQVLHFLIDLPDFYPKFILSNKNESISEQDFIEAEISKKLTDLELNAQDTFVSALKIAPFVYQFLAVKKEIIESLLEVSSNLGLSLASIVPWGMLLPSLMTNTGEPEIFIVASEDRVGLVLSELNGIYHIGSIKDSTDIHGLTDLVKKLSVYERSKPIKKIYSMNMPGLTFGDDFEVTQLSFTNPNLIFLAKANQELLESQTNLLNLLPLPVKQRSNSLVYVGAVTAALLVLGGVAFGPKYLKNFQNNLAQAPASESSVLSETKENTSQSTVEASPTAKPTEISVEKPELKRAYLKIRVENGTSIAGLAGRTRDYLTNLGYEVVAIGDAEESNREAVLIRFKSANSIYKDLVVSDLNKKFTKVEIGKELDANLTYDTLIIAGTAQVN
ncbi:LytR C-terminal domain-containing protein [candidate division WWE3 bacterium]|nr:LytR C-terminal domain-containing protein [candidate division WWE3 bacterium]